MGLTFNLGRVSPSVFTDSSLNVGIGGSPSGSYKLEVTGTLGVSGLFTSTAFGSNSFSAGGTGYNKLTIRNTTAGAANGAQLSIGTNADPDQFYVQSFATTFTTSGMNIAGGAVVNGEGPGGLSIAATQSNIQFYTNGAGSANERMRISSAGKLLLGTTASSGGIYAMEIGGNTGSIWGKCSGVGDAQFISFSPTIGFHFYAYTSSPIFYVLSNGDVKNANNSYGAISDIKLKENIEDATPKLQDLLKVKIRNYNLISDESKTKQLGVIAQELEEVFPNMISEDKLIGSDETIKTVKYSVFVPMLIKAIQEQQIQIQNLQAQNQDLKSRLDKAGL